MYKVGDKLIIYKTRNVRDYTKGSWTSDAEYINNVCCFLGRFEITKVNKRSYSLKSLDDKNQEFNNVKCGSDYYNYKTNYDPSILDGYKIANESDYDKLSKQLVYFKLYETYSLDFLENWRIEKFNEEVTKCEKELEYYEKILEKVKSKRDKAVNAHKESIEKFTEIWDNLKK
ncbi:MAG: hypothetical protein ACRCX8_20715 [Sarcina sp.]